MQMLEKPKFRPVLSCLPLTHQGKSRDSFDLPRGGELPKHRLIVATRRVSTHNIVHRSAVPYKDEVITAFTVFFLRDVIGKAGIPTHLVASGRRIYDHVPAWCRGALPEDLHNRAIVVDILGMIPREFVFRAYLTGSLYKDFYAKGIRNPYGIDLPPGLSPMSAFDPPIFTPTDKSDTDDPMRADEVIDQYPVAYALARIAFDRVRTCLNLAGFELVDGKEEYGIHLRGHHVLADEVSPDSCRICLKSQIVPGREPEWYDKQIARDEAERVWGTGPRMPLEFSAAAVKNVSERYLELFWRVTGMELADYQSDHLAG